MAGPGETLGSPWLPLTLQACGTDLELHAVLEPRDLRPRLAHVTTQGRRFLFGHLRRCQTLDNCQRHLLHFQFGGTAGGAHLGVTRCGIVD
jgi:hypothetical protein